MYLEKETKPSTFALMFHLLGGGHSNVMLFLPRFSGEMSQLDSNIFFRCGWFTNRQHRTQHKDLDDPFSNITCYRIHGQVSAESVDSFYKAPAA